jgi:hypothetical protein
MIENTSYHKLKKQAIIQAQSQENQNFYPLKTWINGIQLLKSKKAAPFIYGAASLII